MATADVHTANDPRHAIEIRDESAQDGGGPLDELFEHSGFQGIGYWSPGTLEPSVAYEQLVTRLLDRLPSPAGGILEVECGMGATTRHLLRRWPPGQIVGTNLSESQLAACIRNAPGCSFLRMEPTRLEFADDTFDNVICVERAFRFDTRTDFLREVYRVLKPGGGLVLADAIMAAWAPWQPTENILLGPRAYHVQLLTAGFDEIEVSDETRRCWGAFAWHLRRYLARERGAGTIDGSAVRAAARWLRTADAALRHYLLVSCRKSMTDGGRAG